MFYFCKMQATGNDFVLVDYVRQEIQYSFKLLAQYLCDRHYGVGADGVVIIDKSKVADLKMRIFNPDGEEAEMCGNGLRCFAKYVYEHGIITKENFQVETKAGIKDIQLIVEGKTVLKVKVEIGEPVFEYEKIPVIYDEYEIIEECKKIKDTTQKIDNEKQDEANHIEKNNDENKVKINKMNIEQKEFYAVSMGNPHVVCFVENLEELQIEQIGKKVENYKYFPNRTNVEFVQIIDNNHIKVRVWERGVGETLSCGTGACAAAVISHIVKSTNCEITVDLKGGNLDVNYDKENKKVYLEGEAMEVFIGSVTI